MVTLCFTRVYVATVADVLRKAPAETRECIDRIAEHLARVSAAYEQHAILNLHQKSRPRRRTPSK